MSFLTYESSTGLLGLIRFDAIESESHSDSSTATQHAVEVGAAISDHVRAERPRVSVVAFITNTPLGSDQDLADRLGAKEIGQLRGVNADFLIDTYFRRWTNGAQVSGGDLPPFQPPLVKIKPTPIKTQAAQSVIDQDFFSGTSLQFPTSIDRVSECLAGLRYLINSGITITYYSKLRTYEDMVITSMTVPQEPVDAVSVSLDMQQVKYASVRSAVVTKKKPTKPAVKRAEETKSADAAPLKWDVDEETEGGKAFLAKLYDSAQGSPLGGE